jgi:PAS domain S-box-containing protein
MPTTRAPEQNREDAAPGLIPGLSRLLGVGLTLLVILGYELIPAVHVSAPVAIALMALCVAFAGNRGGPLPGLAAAVLATAWTVHVLAVQTGASGPGAPLLPGLLAGGGLIAVAVIVGRLRTRLERIARAAEVDRAASSQQLAGAMEDVSRARSEIRLQARLLDAVGQAVVATDATGHVVYANRAAAGLYDMEPDAMRGRLVTEVAPVPEPGSGSDDTLDRLGRRAAWIGEAVVRQMDGHGVPLLVTDAPLLDNARSPSGMVRVMTDLSPHRRAERGQRILADAGAVLSASLDHASTLRNLTNVIVPELADVCLIDVLDSDDEAERLEAKHVDPQRESVARDLRRRYPLSMSSLHPTADVMRTGRSLLLPEIPDLLLREIARDEDHLRTLRSLGYRTGMIVPLRTAGRTLGAISLFRVGSQVPPYTGEDLRLAEEIARRAATALDHARLYEQAVLANRAKSDFLAVMSHELRTPLTTIIGYAELMLSGVPEPIGGRGEQYVKRVRAAADHLLGLIDQILVYARIELGRLDTQPEPVSVGDLVFGVAQLVEPVALERGLEFRVHPVEPLRTRSRLRRRHGHQHPDAEPDGGDFGGPALEGCNDYLVITRPDVIEGSTRRSWRSAATCWRRTRSARTG